MDESSQSPSELYRILRAIKYLLKGWFWKLANKILLPFIRGRNVGKNSYIDPSVHVLGWRNVKIGDNTIISQDTWINVNHRHIKEISVVIGNNCFVGRRNFFSPGNLIKLGDYCLITSDCKFLGAGHVYESPFVPYVASGATRGGEIELGTNCWLGANVIVLKGVKIGYGSIIGAGAIVNRNVPPLSVVVGNPGRVIKRFDMRLQTWVKVKEYDDKNDQDLLSEAEYLEILNKTGFNPNSVLVASSKLFGDL